MKSDFVIPYQSSTVCWSFRNPSTLSVRANHLQSFLPQPLEQQTRLAPTHSLCVYLTRVRIPAHLNLTTRQVFSRTQIPPSGGGISGCASNGKRDSFLFLLVLVLSHHRAMPLQNEDAYRIIVGGSAEIRALLWLTLPREDGIFEVGLAKDSSVDKCEYVNCKLLGMRFTMNY